MEPPDSGTGRGTVLRSRKGKNLKLRTGVATGSSQVSMWGIKTGHVLFIGPVGGTLIFQNGRIEQMAEADLLLDRAHHLSRGYAGRAGSGWVR